MTSESESKVREALSDVYHDENLPDEANEWLLAQATEKVLALLAQAWDEGFDAGERDVHEHEQHGYETPCIPNPYRAIPPIQRRQTCIHPEGYDRLSGPCPTCGGDGVIPPGSTGEAS